MTAATRAAAAVAAVAAAAIAAAAPALRAQDVCFPPPTANESRTLALYSLPLAFSAAAAPRAPVAGEARVRLALEVTYLPRPSDAMATPTLCRPGTGPAISTSLPAFPRPRLALLLPLGVVAEAGWVPPVRLEQVRANLVGLAVERTLALRPALALRVRGHATFGSVEAPLTCPDEALRDPDSECFDGQRSNDRFRPNIVGVETALGVGAPGARLRPYVGAGYNWLRPRFRVHFVNRVGETDRTRVEVNLQRVMLFGGASWQATPALSLGGELYVAPQDGATGRVMLATTLGRRP